MQTNVLINTAYMDTRKTERGFSFISVLIMITITFLTIPLAIQLIKVNDFDTNYDSLSVNQFFIFLRDEVIQSVDLAIESDKLTYLQNDESTATLEFYDNKVIRKVDNTGFQVFLQDVDNLQFESLDHGLTVSIKTTNGNFYNRNIFYD